MLLSPDERQPSGFLEPVSYFHIEATLANINMQKAKQQDSIHIHLTSPWDSLLVVRSESIFPTLWFGMNIYR